MKVTTTAGTRDQLKRSEWIGVGLSILLLSGGIFFAIVPFPASNVVIDDSAYCPPPAQYVMKMIEFPQPSIDQQIRVDMDSRSGGTFNIAIYFQPEGDWEFHFLLRLTNVTAVHETIDIIPPRLESIDLRLLGNASAINATTFITTSCRVFYSMASSALIFGSVIGFLGVIVVHYFLRNWRKHQEMESQRR